MPVALMHASCTPQKQDSGANQDGVINGWDLMYYHTILLDTEYKLDEDKIKEYFPLDKVTDGMFEIYQQLLGLRFEKVRRPSPTDKTSLLLYVSSLCRQRR
jgi:Zn-dependent oligopeptidase